MACFNYNVNIEQSDLNIADGNIVYVDYYPCPSGSTTQRGYTTAGFYPNDFCNDNNVGTPTIYMLVGGFSAATSSSVVQTFISCDVTPTPTETPTQTPTPTQTSTITPTQTPSVTSTTNQSPTPTTTQTVTPTITSSITPTPSITPSTTPLFCVSGTTTGSHYYTDCCGSFISGSDVGTVIIYNPQLPNLGITNSNLVATTSCNTPTPTPTPSITPTLTSTPTLTPTITSTSTPTPTPTRTPAPTQVITLQNNCSVVTLFDMGVNCRTLVQPSTLTSFDGALTLDITGGTSPYSVFWVDSNSKTATRTGLKQGEYEAVVVDFYGDYTASTFCSLEAIVPSPTPTNTVTPTPSLPPIYSSLCVLIIGVVPALSPIQFTYNGVVNGRPVWISGSYTLDYNVTNRRWQINGLSVNGGTPISTSTSTPPLSNWTIVGGSLTPIPQVIVLEGVCPPFTPLNVTIQTENSDCGNDGSINILASGGLTPYQYSINGGATYTTTSVFNGLSANTYNVVVKDTSGTTINKSVVISQVGTINTYTVSVSNTNVQSPSANLRTSSWLVSVNPPIPVGTVISFILNVETIQNINSPGSGITSSVNQVYQNTTLLTPSNTTTNNSVTTRPRCSPFTTETTNILQTYSIVMSAGTVVSGISDSSLTITSGQSSSNGCSTNLQQNISVLPQQATINGCQCCTVVTNGTSYGGFEHSLSLGQGSGILNYTQLVFGVGIDEGSACSNEIVAPTRLINSQSFGVGVTLFQGNPTSPTPLLGYNYCSYQTALYYVNPATGQVTGAVLFPNGTQVFC